LLLKYIFKVIDPTLVTGDRSQVHAVYAARNWSRQQTDTLTRENCNFSESTFAKDVSFILCLHKNNSESCRFLKKLFVKRCRMFDYSNNWLDFADDAEAGIFQRISYLSGIGHCYRIPKKFFEEFDVSIAKKTFDFGTISVASDLIWSTDQIPLGRFHHKLNTVDPIAAASGYMGWHTWAW